MCLFTKIYLIIIYIALNVSYEQKLYIYSEEDEINCFGLCSNTYFVSYIYDCLLGPVK
jgi:hypothetical protein